MTALGVGIAAAIGLPVFALGGGALYTRASTKRAERIVPPLGQFRELGGARLHYVDIGQGAPIVAIHGLGAQLRNFTYGVADRLSGRHRLICVDRPAAGYSVAGRGDHPDLAAQAAMIAGLIRSLGLDRPLIVGHSLGGAVALRMALDHPDCVGALALLSPLALRQDAVPSAFRAMVIPSRRVRWIVSRTLAVPLGLLNRRKAQAAVFAPEPCPADFDTRGGNALLFRPCSFFGASSEISVGSAELNEMIRRYPALRRRVAILFAHDDRILDPEVHGVGMVGAAPDVHLDLIDGGHMFPITRPERTAAWIADQAAALMQDRATRAVVAAK